MTFAFTGHVESLRNAVDPTNDTTPRVGDPFTGSYTYDSSAGSSSSSFVEVPPKIAADLRVHDVSYSLPISGSVQSYLVIGIEPDKYSVTLGYFGVPPAFGADAHLDLYWTLTDPTGPVPPASTAPTVPPVLSDWTQGPGAVSIELKGTLHTDYTALGVIDTIVAR